MGRLEGMLTMPTLISTIRPTRNFAPAMISVFLTEVSILPVFPKHVRSAPNEHYPGMLLAVSASTGQKNELIDFSNNPKNNDIDLHQDGDNFKAACAIKFSIRGKNFVAGASS